MIAKSLSPQVSENLEKTALLGLGFFYLFLSWLKVSNSVHPGLFYIHCWWECTLKAFFVLLVFLGRYGFFAPYRRKTYLRLGIFGVFLMKIACYIFCSPPLDEWFMPALMFADFSILSVLYGTIIEFTCVIFAQILFAEKPFDYDLSLISHRFRAGERVLSLMAKVIFFYALLIILGFYSLSTFTLFNWAFYSIAGGCLLLLIVLITIEVFQSRLQKENLGQLRQIDQMLDKWGKTHFGPEGLGPAAPVETLNEVYLVIQFRQYLRSAERIPWNCQTILVILGSMLLILVQPYFYRMFLLK